MGLDFTSYTYPSNSEILPDGEENHAEPQSESIKSSVLDAEHPIFGLKEAIKTVNLRRLISNTLEELLSGEIDPQVMKDLGKAAFKKGFPAEMLMMAADLKEKLTDRSGMSDADSISEDISSYIPSLKSTLGRAPKNFEAFMAYALESSSKVKELLDKAEQKPNEKAEEAGSKYDDIIFWKKKFDVKVKRTNKEVIQFFYKRMLNGNDFFPHAPLGRKT